jgi:Fic family protein
LTYIYQRKQWPRFRWDELKLAPLLVDVRHRQGRLLGRMEGLGFALQAEANLQTLSLDVIKSSEIEGEILPPDQVRSSLARRLGINIEGLVSTDRHVDGMVEMMLDATQQFSDALNPDRLFGWHAALFPTGRIGMHRKVVGNWRDNLPQDPMQVVSGPIGRETVHFQAPDASLIPDEMKAFLHWFNTHSPIDALIKAAIAHLWFVTIHPFDDGNGRIARAITDLQLARADGHAERFYSMSAQIRKERNAYYETLEETQKGDLDITVWLEWFLGCLNRAIGATDQTLGVVLQKAKFWDQHAALSLNDRQRMMLNKLLDGFDGKLNSSKWAKICKCSSDTAVRDINDLIEKGILEKENAGGRSTSYRLQKKLKFLSLY